MWGGERNERHRRESLGGPGGMFPQKLLKFGSPEISFLEAISGQAGRNKTPVRLPGAIQLLYGASRSPWQRARRASKAEPETLKMYTFSEFTLQYFDLIRSNCGVDANFCLWYASKFSCTQNHGSDADSVRKNKWDTSKTKHDANDHGTRNIREYVKGKRPSFAKNILFC